MASNAPPQAAILHMLMGTWVAQALGAVARLGVADQLADGPKTSDEVAAAVGANPDNLARTLRALSAVGIFASVDGGKWGLTPVGETLKTDAPFSMRYMAIAETDHAHWATWERFTECVRTGEAQAVPALGSQPWDYYAKHPDDGANFSRAMANVSSMAIDPVLASYDVSWAAEIADIGGAYGALLAGVLRMHPTAKGILFDLPAVVEGAGPVLGDVANRVERIGGNFLKDALPGADLYLLKHVLHDWDDENSIAILKGVRAAMKPGAKVAVIELVIPVPLQPGPSTMMDLNMMVMLNGRERTSAEYGVLFEKAGLKSTRTVSTPSPFAVVEAEAG
jgi:hypothetical protein